MLKFHIDGALPPRDDSTVFVFGSNLKGIHGAGAAKAARDLFDAKPGFAVGPQGRSYAIPTKRDITHRLDLPHIRKGVDRFIEYARSRPDLEFFVTRIGCGLAGYEDREIAPMFMLAPDNCSFAEGWREYLTDIRVRGEDE